MANTPMTKGKGQTTKGHTQKANDQGPEPHDGEPNTKTDCKRSKEQLPNDKRPMANDNRPMTNVPTGTRLEDNDQRQTATGKIPWAGDEGSTHNAKRQRPQY